MKKLLFISIFLITLCISNSLLACTAFVAEDGETVLVGNNEDWFKKYPIELKFEQSEKGRYGRVYFVYNNLTQAGINTEGFMFDFFATLFSSPQVTISEDKKEYQGKLMNKVLEECATVEQALQLIAHYNLGFLEEHNCQIFIVDKTGDSAIIEGDTIIRREGEYQVVTNFHQSKVKDENKPCEFYRFGCKRYKTAVEMLDNRENITLDGFRKILHATHQSGLVKTLYSYICDLKKGLIYAYNLHNFDDVAVINLHEELQKGNHSYDLSSLFPKQ